MGVERRERLRELLGKQKGEDLVAWAFPSSCDGGRGDVPLHCWSSFAGEPASGSDFAGWIQLSHLTPF